MTFKKAEMEKTLRNGLCMSKADPSTKIGWISRFRCGWHYTSFKKKLLLSEQIGNSEHCAMTKKSLITKFDYTYLLQF